MKKFKLNTNTKTYKRNLIIASILYFGSIPLSILLIIYLEGFGESTYLLRELLASIFAFVYLFFAIYLYVPITILLMAIVVSKFPKGAKYVANHPYIKFDLKKNKGAQKKDLRI
jgi:hypothetical protein